MVSTKDLRIGILTGPTATGKSSIALQMAIRSGKIEIINADSLLVYRGMNIGTAKPLPSELALVPHHLIDIRNPNESFTAGEFYRAAFSAICEIHKRGRRALIVGGTGFYLKALLYGLWPAPPSDPVLKESLQQIPPKELFLKLEKVDPQSAQRIGMTDPYRLIRALELIELTGKTPTELQASLPQEPDPRFQLWILDRPNAELHERIRLRTEQMLKSGLIAEFEQIHSLYPDCRALQSIGYAQVGAYLQGTLPEGRKIKSGLPGLSEEIQLATRQLVKRQRTLLRGQLPAQWFEVESELSKLEEAFKAVYE